MRILLLSNYIVNSKRLQVHSLIRHLRGKTAPLLCYKTAQSNQSRILHRFYRDLGHQPESIDAADQRLDGCGDDIVV